MNGNVLFEIKDLQKKFGSLTVFDGLNETICKGDVVVIIGPSGGGKSTFIRCLNLLEQPTAGKIYFEGEDITAKGFDVNKHRQKVGMVFQQFNLFNNLTVLENITISLTKVKKQSEEESKEKALKLLKRVGLEDKANAYPSQLSGGQKQRIAIVRALAMEPEVMLFEDAVRSSSLLLFCVSSFMPSMTTSDPCLFSAASSLTTVIPSITALLEVLTFSTVVMTRCRSALMLSVSAPSDSFR